MATSMTDYSNNTISQIVINNTTYDITDATTRSIVSNLDSRIGTLENTVSNKVSKTGDTMTGGLNIKYSALDRDGSNPSAVQWASSVVILDKDGERLAILETSRAATGATQTYLRSYTDNTSNTQVDNYIRLDANKDGTKTYGVADPAKFRAAIGAGTGNVTGVKGNKESTYRTGNVNLTPANIGAMDTVLSESQAVTVPANLHKTTNWPFFPLYKIGKVVTLVIKGFQAPAVNTETQFGSIPSGYRPPTDMAVMLQDNSKASVRFLLKADGTVSCYNYDKTAGAVFNFNGHPVVWGTLQ